MIDVALNLDERQLAVLGIKSGTHLLAAVQAPYAFQQICKQIEMKQPDLLRWLSICDLLRVPRLTLPMAYMLNGIGIRTVNQLSKQSAVGLYEQVQSLNLRSTAKRARVGKRLCEIWVGCAKGLKPVQVPTETFTGLEPALATA